MSRFSESPWALVEFSWSEKINRCAAENKNDFAT